MAEHAVDAVGKFSRLETASTYILERSIGEWISGSYTVLSEGASRHQPTCRAGMSGDCFVKCFGDGHIDLVCGSY